MHHQTSRHLESGIRPACQNEGDCSLAQEWLNLLHRLKFDPSMINILTSLGTQQYAVAKIKYTRK
jgi:hypothetical protein